MLCSQNDWIVDLELWIGCFESFSPVAEWVYLFVRVPILLLKFWIQSKNLWEVVYRFFYQKEQLHCTTQQFYLLFDVFPLSLLLARHTVRLLASSPCFKRSNRKFTETTKKFPEHCFFGTSLLSWRRKDCNHGARIRKETSTMVITSIFMLYMFLLLHICLHSSL